jgi:hypothetical protein
MFNIQAVDKLIQFVLTAAGQEDDARDRELGQIHLIKYLYLADLLYAEQHEGKIYTGVRWKFHHFGPWSHDVYQRIEPSLQHIQANKRIIPSNYEDDFVRWSLCDDQVFHQLQEEIPLFLRHAIQKYVHKFIGITEDLLHFIYNTRPMLKAKPGDVLDFTSVAPTDKEQIVNISEHMVETRNSILSVRQKKKKQQSLERLRQQFKERLEAKKKRKKVYPDPPRYDEVFYEGINALDAIAGIGFPEGTGIVQFSNDIWTSKARFDPDVP